MTIHHSVKEINWVTVKRSISGEPWVLYSWERGKTIGPESCFLGAAKIRFFETEHFAFSMFNYSQLCTCRRQLPIYVQEKNWTNVNWIDSIHMRTFLSLLCSVMTPIYQKIIFSSYIHIITSVHIICFVKSEWSLLLEEDQTEIPHRLLLSLVGFPLRTSQSWEFLHRLLRLLREGVNKQNFFRT